MKRDKFELYLAHFVFANGVLAERVASMRQHSKAAFQAGQAG